MSARDEYFGKSGKNGARSAPKGAAETPAFDLRAEQGLIGSVITDPEEVMPSLLESIAEDDLFFDGRNKTVWQACKAIFDAQPKFDLVVVCSYLENLGLLAAAGGASYVSSLLGATPSAFNFRQYLEICREKFVARKFAEVLQKSLDEVKAAPATASQVANATTEALVRIDDLHTAKAFEARKISANFPEIVTELQSFKLGRQQMRGMSWGLHYLDNATCGIWPGQYVVIAARPSVGKTAIGLQIATYAASQGSPVCFFSFEQQSKSLAIRQMFQRAKVDSQKYRNGFLKEEEDGPKLFAALKELHGLPFYVVDDPDLSLERLAMRARRMVRQYGVKLFVLDYVQLAKGYERSRYEGSASGKSQEISDISAAICGLKKRLGVPWIVLSQLSRTLDTHDKPPTMGDLKGSGSLEQDADVVLLLWKEDLRRAAADPEKPQNAEKLDFLQTAQVQALPSWVTEDWERHLTRVNLSLEKNREGPTGICKLVRINPWVEFIDPYRNPRGASARARRDRYDGDAERSPFAPAEGEG